ncbi:MAG: hypothetical protein R6V20_00925 [Desulfobia sp.]
MPWYEKLKFFLLGILTLTGLLLLTGASENSSSPTLNYGRYQITSWAGQMSKNSGVIGAFVMDTVSGETKTVYLREYGDVPSSRLLKNDLKKSFSAVE